jgi:uncharacterized protein (DUF58 family)
MSERERQYLIEGERAGSRYALAVPRRAASARAGWQPGSRAGSSLEFRDYRDYQPGDDLRRIDWNAFARSDRLMVKLYREELSPHLDLVLDGSRSMALEESAKGPATLGLAAALAVAAGNAGYSHQAWLAREWCEPVINGNQRPAAWGGIDFDFRATSPGAFALGQPRFGRQGMRILISDLLWPGEPLTILRQLALGATAIIVLQVLAGVDLQPPERGLVRLVDSETEDEREIYLDDRAIARYREALARHRRNWHLACRQIGAVMVELIAEQVVAGWNLEELVKAEVLKA